MHDIESGTCQPRWETIARVSTVLGSTLHVALYPGTGPLIRDHLQGAMLGALIRIRHPRWLPRPEVTVHRPVRGVIDLVLDDDAEAISVAIEGQSELRRLEQQLRWSKAKADALAAVADDVPGPTRTIGKLLLLRSTARTRATVAQYADLVAAAYPARAMDAYAALTGNQRWPGDAILWCRVEGEQATVLDRPPRGIRVGR